MYLQPAPGRVVPDPERRDLLPAQAVGRQHHEGDDDQEHQRHQRRGRRQRHPPQRHAEGGCRQHRHHGGQRREQHVAHLAPRVGEHPGQHHQGRDQPRRGRGHHPAQRRVLAQPQPGVGGPPSISTRPS